jgi:hypothetical protein
MTHRPGDYLHEECQHGVGETCGYCRETNNPWYALRNILIFAAIIGGLFVLGLFLRS